MKTKRSSKKADEATQELVLEMAVAIMDMLASDKRYRNWLDKSLDNYNGSIGVYQDIIQRAQRIVTADGYDGTIDSLYTKSYEIADHMLKGGR